MQYVANNLWYYKQRQDVKYNLNGVKNSWPNDNVGYLEKHELKIKKKIKLSSAQGYLDLNLVICT